MSGYTKYFENVGKTCIFKLKIMWDKYDKVCDVIEDKLGIKFHSEPVYEYEYLKVKVREFDGVIKTNFLGNDVPKENMPYTCIACITIDSALRIDKKNRLQVYLEQCKYRVKKTQMFRFINTELKSDSESSDSDSEKVDNKLMTKLKSHSDNDSE